MLEIIKGDLFKVDESYHLVHCISEDCVMGKGIARTFRTLYPDMPKKIKSYMKLQNKHYPCSIAYEDINGRFIFNLITKQNYWDKPSYKSLRISLEELKRHLCILGINKIAMPKIGCGLDRLKWEKVLVILEEVFDKEDIKIYYLEE